MTKLADVLQRLEENRYKLAVWIAIENYLCPLIDKDDHRTSDSFVQSPGCSEPYVPQDVVQDVIDRIREEEIQPLTAKIKAIESLTVEDKEDGKAQSGKEKKSTKTAGKKLRKKGVGTKKVRTVRVGTRRKSTGTG